MIDIEVMETSHVTIGQNVSILSYFLLPKGDYRTDLLSIGLDPGTVNTGITLIDPTEKYWACRQIKIKRDKNPVERIKTFFNLIDEICHTYEGMSYMTIEGPAFSESYRQVELAEVRTVAALWAIHLEAEVQYYTPQTIRKRIFGDGKIKAHEFWTNLPADAAASLSCALMPLI